MTENLQECGKKPKETHTQNKLSQISGGHAAPGKWPWMALLKKVTNANKLHPTCGATLLGDSWIITAAHCVYNVESKDQIRIYLGLNSVNSNDNGKVHEIEDVYIHNRFHEEKPYNYDIAILKLRKKANLHPANVNSICLPDDDLDSELVEEKGKRLTIAGIHKTKI